MNKTPQHRLDSSARQRAKIKADPLKAAAQREYMRNYSQENKARLNQQSQILYQKNKVKIRLQRKGIMPTDELISKIQEHCGQCDICGAEGDGRWKELAIDHCHESGKYRGMLCSSCNRALGLFKDNTELLSKAIDYLIQYRKTLPNEYVPD